MWKQEGIRIGDVRYTRQKDGSWVKEPPTSKTGGRVLGTGNGRGTLKRLRKRRLNTFILEKRRSMARKQHIIANSKSSNSRRTHQFSFVGSLTSIGLERTGYLLRNQKRTPSKTPISVIKSVTEYEYDSNIKIAAHTRLTNSNKVSTGDILG